MYTTANYCSSLAADLSIFQGFKISFYLTFLCVAQFARECFHADFQISRFPDYQAKIHVSKLTTYLHISTFLDYQFYLHASKLIFTHFSFRT